MGASQKRHILIVEDEPKIAQLLADYLHENQFITTHLSEGNETSDWVKEHVPDCVLLDLMLPGKDGLEVCREIRQFSNVPILMITARVDEIDRILGLEIGADDYICKPFSPREVVARVKSTLRRIDSINNDFQTSSLTLDRDNYSVVINQKQLDLTPVEFRLLETLNRHPDRVFSRQQLLDNLYSDHRIVTDRTIDSHIKNLRKKMIAAGCDTDVIKSIYGVGYKLDSLLLKIPSSSDTC